MFSQPKCNMQQISQSNHIVRYFQKKYVETSLAEVIDNFDEAGGLDQLVAAVRLKCLEKGWTMSESLVEALILEIAQGFPEWAFIQ